MRGDDAPSLRQPDPRLALPAAGDTFGCIPFKFKGDAGEIVTEADDFQPLYSAGEVGGGAGFAKGFEFVVAVEVFGDAEAHDLGRGPEHGYQGFYIVRDERLFVAWVELSQFGEHFGQVHFLGLNGHTKSSLSGRMLLLIAPLTVYMGSFTTWLRRNLRATLHRM